MGISTDHEIQRYNCDVVLLHGQSGGSSPSIPLSYQGLNPLYRSIFMYYVNDRTSTACDLIAVNPLTKVAVVRYNNGREYTYKNVSRRSIIKLMADRSVSLGFFANQLKKDSKDNSKKTHSLGLTGFGYERNLVAALPAS